MQENSKYSAQVHIFGQSFTDNIFPLCSSPPKNGKTHRYALLHRLSP